MNNNAHFDTEAATLLAHNLNQAGNGTMERLYKMPDGRFFLHTGPNEDQGLISYLEAETAGEYYNNLPDKEATYLEAFGEEEGINRMIHRARTLRRKLKKSRKWEAGKKARALYELMGIYQELIPTIPIGN